jgi:hypothetical protein
MLLKHTGCLWEVFHEFDLCETEKTLK